MSQRCEGRGLEYVHKSFRQKATTRQAHQSRATVVGLLERLESRQLLSASPVISEIMASNSSGLVDGNGNHSDWIEIHNQGDAAQDLTGWHLSDDASKPTKWTFPSYSLAAGAYMVVFADSSGTPDKAGDLHTNFSLSADGENVSLRQPDGTLVSEIAANGAAYPKQVADVSYGPTKILDSTTLLTTGAAAKAFVPTNGFLDSGAWTAVGYDDSTWISGTTAVGFDGGGTAPATNLLADWNADSLTSLGNNASVSSWSATTGTGTATQSTTADKPKVITNSLNGHSVVRFDGSNDNLKITNQSLNGDTSYSVSVVFRTSAAGTSGGEWYNNTGIVDAEVAGVTNDWGVAINDTGAVGAGVGNPDTTIYSTSGLANGSAHIAVFTKNGTTTALSIDGGVPIYGTASAAARNVSELVFGSIHTNIQYFNGDIADVRLYSAALTDDAVRSLGTTLASTYGITAAPGLYSSQLRLNLQSQMANKATTADIRVPFTVSNPSQYDTLTLGMKYDDGFVAYLNGTEVARRNAPSGTITYTTTASSARPDSAALTYESIDISSFINLLQGNGASNVLAIKALNSSFVDSDLLISPTLTGSISTSGLAYMTTPTPGAANQPGYVGLVSPVTYSKTHGYYSNAVSTVLTTATPGATIVYTLDGSDPSLTSGTKVLPADASSFAATTLNLSATTVVRAAAFKTNYLDSAITSASYFFVADIIRQPEYTPSGAYWDVGMDSDVVNNTTQTYSVAQALTAVPTISLVLPNADMFGSDGIYTNPEQKGDAWERETSVEYFDPNNSSNQFSIDAGVQVQGGVDRDTSRPKKSFELSFKSEYGASKLDYPFFGTSIAQQSFDHIILKAIHSYSWANLGGEPPEQADYLRDEFARETQIAEGGKAAVGSFVQLYINGQYWGMYNAVEDVDQNWAASNYGGNASDYNIVKPDGNGGIYADEGTLDSWNNLFNTTAAAAADGTVSANEYASISQLVDTKALVDYMLDIFYRGDNDAPVLIGSTTSPRNFIAVQDGATSGKYEFETWDGEISFTDVNYDRTEVGGNMNPATLYQELRTNPDFRQLVVDETHRLFTGNGALTASANESRYQGLMSQINVAIVGESARWGNAKQSTVMTRDGDWVPETSWIVGTYMPQRSSVVLSQLTADYPELNTLAPSVKVNGVVTTGGSFVNGALVTFADNNTTTGGTIYYTLDGSDPRAAGGGVSTSAAAYSGTGFALNQGQHVLARELLGGTWSALTDVALTTSTPFPVRISEINYNPAATTGVTDSQDLEFLELVNTSNQTVSLAGVKISKAFDYTFGAGTTLAAGAYVIIPRNSAIFTQVYGNGINLAAGAGYSTQNLSNSGEEIVLTGPLGETLEDFTYSIKAPWPTAPAGGGYSLEAIDPTADPSVPANWRASFLAGGSPGNNGLPTPKVASSTFGYQTAQTVNFTFDQAMDPSSFQLGDVTIAPLAGGAAITPTSVTYAAATRTVTFGFNNIIADGDYVATLAAGSVADGAGTPTAAPGTLSFFVLAGDVNRDRKVDIGDLGILATHWQKTGATWSQGDMDYSGRVDIGDLGILSTNWQKNLGPAPTVTSTTVAAPVTTPAAPPKTVVAPTPPATPTTTKTVVPTAPAPTPTTTGKKTVTVASQVLG